MGMAVRIRDEEFGLTVVAVDDFRGAESESDETLPECVDIARSPVKSDPFVIPRKSRGANALIEPERKSAAVDQATDHATLPPHGIGHGELKPIHPEVQALFQIQARNDGDAGVDKHRWVY